MSLNLESRCQRKMSAYHFCKKATYGCIAHGQLHSRQDAAMRMFRRREGDRRWPLSWVNVVVLRGLGAPIMHVDDARARFDRQVARIQHFSLLEVNA
jgi:hypothetical protein